MPSEIVPSNYSQLLSTLRREVAGGIRDAQRALERERLLMYWKIGRSINVYLQRTPQGDTVGTFYRQLSADLGIVARVLEMGEQFYRYYPDGKFDQRLTWSHYCRLLTVPDAIERQRWVTDTIQGEWSVKTLRDRLSDAQDVAAPGQSAIDPGEPARGRLYTYRLVRGDLSEGKLVGGRLLAVGDDQNFDNLPATAYSPFWLVDIGFANRIDAPPCAGVLDNRYFVTSVKEDGAYRLQLSNARASDLFTFKARLRRIIDADTLAVDIDQGFGVWTAQKLRLRGLDAPEIGTQAGQRACRKVTEMLTGAEFLIVRTSKSDKYDRYLADIFYLPGETDAARVAAEGRWLNGEMLAQGLATVWA